MVSKTKIKNNVKRAFRLPNNAVVMSLMAALLVVGAPTLVSIIDDSYSADVDIVSDLSFIEGVPNVGYYWDPSAPEETVKTVTELIVGNNISFAVNDPESAEYLLHVMIKNIDPASFRDVSKTTIYSDALTWHSTSGRMTLTFDDASTIVFYDFTALTDADGAVIGYEKEYSSYEKVLLSSDDLASVSFNFSNVEKSVYREFEIVNEIGMTIPYGEIIIGATGALLLICALFATPWFSTSGLTIRRR